MRAWTKATLAAIICLALFWPADSGAGDRRVIKKSASWDNLRLTVKFGKPHYYTWSKKRIYMMVFGRYSRKAGKKFYFPVQVRNQGRHRSLPVVLYFQKSYKAKPRTYNVPSIAPGRRWNKMLSNRYWKQEQKHLFVWLRYKGGKIISKDYFSFFYLVGALQ